MNISRRQWRGPAPLVNTLRPLGRLSQRARISLGLEGLLLMLGIWAVLTLSLPGQYGSFEVGQPSPQSIVAPADVTYISEVLTAEKQAQAENSSDNLVYIYDPNIPIAQRQSLSALLDTIQSLRTDPQLGRDERMARLVGLPNAALEISEERADLILALDDQGWDTLRAQTLAVYDRALGRYDYVIDERALQQLRERWLSYWLATTALSATGQELAKFFIEPFLQVNRTLDAAATAERSQRARDAVPPQQVRVRAGESIVRVGDIVTPATIEKLRQTGAMPSPLSWPGVLGRGALAGLLALAFILYVVLFQNGLSGQPRTVLVIVGCMVATLLAARLALPLIDAWPYAFPLAMLAIVFAVVFNGRLSLAAVAVVSVVIGVLDNNSLPLAATLFLSATAGVMIARSADHLLTFLLAGLGVAATIVVCDLAFWLIGQPSLSWQSLAGMLLPRLLFAAMNGALSTILALGVFNLVSRAAGQVTPLQLMELAHPSRPLLRKLIREAPGTYYHSVAVGNLAEAAAEVLGADALLLRVAAYYHDIGKTVRPYFFTDNQVGRENVHNDLDPQTSAQIIVDHVREGVKMARSAHLPSQIVDFIATHHGTGLIKHFYQLALQQQDGVRAEDFRYPGPRPQTREQAILMLADSVEATVRSKAQHGKLLPAQAEGGLAGGAAANGAQTLDDLVQSIIDARVREGELDEAPLTMRELAQIKKVFVNSLQSIYHPRVDYAPQVVR